MAQIDKQVADVRELGFFSENLFEQTLMMLFDAMKVLLATINETVCFKFFKKLNSFFFFVFFVFDRCGGIVYLY